MVENSGPLVENLGQEFLDSIANAFGAEEEAVIVSSLPTIRNEKQDARSISRLLELVNQIEQMEKGSGTNKWFDINGQYPISTLPKHEAFFAAGKEYPERLFMAGNRVGKSIAGCYELCCHLTGDYPIWWNGITFDKPIQAWAVGKDARAVRDTAQRELLGPIGEWGTGMLPAHTLGKAFGLQGTPQAIDIVKVRHKSGGWSELGFKNYQQDIGSFMGTSRHVVWLDEECPLEIYNECNVRTATVDGIMLVTFTPLEGLTPMVVNFCKKADFLMGAKPVVAVDQTEDGESFEDEGNYEFLVGRNTAKAVIQAGWDDAPWLSDEMKFRLLQDTPIHLRDARSKGTPAMGNGSVYPIPLEEILVNPITIPDSWPRMYALDVGWNRTAVIWAALDPVTDTIYLYDEHYRGQEMPSVHGYAIQSRGAWIHGVIDPASRGRSQVDGVKLMRSYKDLGLLLFPAKNELESGILMCSQRLAAGKLRVFKTLVNFQKEYLLYRRDKHGKPVSENDHLLDCMRYIINNTNRMMSSSDHTSSSGVKYAPPRYSI
jgi:phage terminase large subunit-like protein